MVQGAPEASETAPNESAALGLAPGDLVADRYRVERLLGEGGMGAVYRAQHVHMRKAVALKVLHPDAGEFPEVVARFEREAIAAAHIDHPNIVSATDFGKLPDGSFFLVLEYVDGESLRDAIAQGPLSPERALHVVREIASALVVAHRSGVVHRDLKPENVMLVAREGALEAIKVFDFGIAKIDVGRVTSKEGSTLQPITRVGTVFGTPDYMAPEQAMGQPVDGRADLYALGVMLFEMLTGSRPYKGGAVTLMRQHILQDPPDLPPEVAQKVDAAIGPVLKKLLAKDADDRYADAAELVAAIDAITGRAPSAPPPGRVQQSGAAPSRAPGAGSAPRDDSTPSVALTPALPVPVDRALVPLSGAGAAYSAEGSKRRRRTTSIFVAIGALIVGGAGFAFWSMRRPTPHAGGPVSAAAAPSASAAIDTPPLPAESASAVAPAPEPEPSAEPAPAPDPTPPPEASASAARAPARASASSPTREPAPQRPHGGAAGTGRGKRKTGPGGIYVPPPKDWIK